MTTSLDSGPNTRGWWLGSIFVLLVVGFFVMPRGYEHSVMLTPDATEHLLIANSWVNGSGFVNPVQWAFNFDAAIPRPAFAVRPPVLPMLLAIPLSLGANAYTVIQLHAFWGCLWAAALVPVGCRFMSVTAATVAALVIGLSTVWGWSASQLWTEPTAVAMFLIILVTARGVTQSALLALICSAATLIGWGVKPQLGAMVLAVSVVAVWELGPRASLRHAGIWTYILAFFAGYTVIHLVTTAMTGYAPYSGFVGAFEVLKQEESSRFTKQYVGTWPFLQENWRQVLSNMGLRVQDLVQALFFSGLYNFAGWFGLIGIPGVLLMKRSRVSLERRLCAFAAIGNAAVVVLVHGSFDGWRYPILVAVPSVLCGVALLDDFFQAASRRLAERRGRPLPRLGPVLPLLVVVLILIQPLTAYRFDETRIRLNAYWKSLHAPGPPISSFLVAGWNPHDTCSRLPPDALLTGRDAWGYSAWCGNPAVLFPRELFNKPLWRKRFYEHFQPEYMISEDDSLIYGELQVVDGPPGSTPIYNVVGNEKRGNWTPPPPLVCAGRGPACREWLGR